MGMAIIKAIVDELDVRDGRDGRGTVVHMTKYLATSPSPSS
jgi:anti-sigma regulatory factor (Ser/Thr protein kinase)